MIKMMNGINAYKQGEIIVMKVPYKDSGTGNILSKKRPVLVISNNIYNSKNNSLIVCSITSNIRKWEKSVPLNNSSLESGNLPLVSELRVDMVNNILKTEAFKSIEILKESILSKAIQNLKEIINKQEELTKYVRKT